MRPHTALSEMGPSQRGDASVVAPDRHSARTLRLNPPVVSGFPALDMPAIDMPTLDMRTLGASVLPTGALRWSVTREADSRVAPYRLVVAALPIDRLPIAELPIAELPIARLGASRPAREPGRSDPRLCAHSRIVLLSVVRGGHERLDPGVPSSLSEEVTRDLASGHSRQQAEAHHHMGIVLTGPYSPRESPTGRRRDGGPARTVRERAVDRGADLLGHPGSDRGCERDDASVESCQWRGFEVGGNLIQLLQSGLALPSHSGLELKGDLLLDVGKADLHDHIAKAVSRGSAGRDRGTTCPQLPAGAALVAVGGSGDDHKTSM